MSLASYHCSTPGSIFGNCRFLPSDRIARFCEPPLNSLLCLAATMAAEHAGRRELAELVADHVLGHEHLRELPAVVDQEREADEVRHDRAGAAPRLDRLAAAGPLLPLDLRHH